MKRRIYCEGSLLDAVQSLKLYRDCKTFVDMPLKNDSLVVLSEWERLRDQKNKQPTVDEVREFVARHFSEPEDELVQCDPEDWDSDTNVFSGIADARYRDLALSLHRKWPSLHRKIADFVRLNADMYSIITVPMPFIVPGGRFREMYYWDSFFTIKGLIASGMLTTAKGMIENLLFLVEQFGFVPNGNRVYYTNRTQPPLLTWCVHAYYEATKDEKFVESSLPTLRKELAFFQTHRSLMLEGWIGPLYRFQVSVTGPRPESYREDVAHAAHYNNFEDKRRLWGDLAAAAESGRDFSSRWFEQVGERAGKLSSTRTSQLIPVDLNAIICHNFTLMESMYDVIGDVKESKWCAQMGDQLRRTIHQVLWNESAGVWFDFDLASGQHVELFFDSNLFPLFAKAAHDDFNPQRVEQYLEKSGALLFPGGIPNSLSMTGEQWDLPNGWAPTNWIAFEGLRNYGLKELADSLTSKWVRKNYNMWRNSGGIMFEKYNVVSPCLKAAGGGGEYAMQEGFGWTNGVLLDILTRHGSWLSWTSGDDCPCCDQRHIPPL